MPNCAHETERRSGRPKSFAVNYVDGSSVFADDRSHGCVFCNVCRLRNWFSLPSSDRLSLRQFGSSHRQTGRDHRIAKRQAPFRAILLRGHSKFREVQPQRFELPAVLQTDQMFRAYRRADGHRRCERSVGGRSNIARVCAPLQSRMQPFDQLKEFIHR
jgi:hypothetical protein